MDNALFLQEAGFEDNTATLDLAIDLLGIVGKADALDLGTTLDDHRRAAHLQILDYGHRIAIQQLGTIAILRHTATDIGSRTLLIKLVRTIRAHIQ